MTTTNSEQPFEPGEWIDYCDDHYIVVANYGNAGAVRHGYTGPVISPFYWKFEGVDCRRVPDAAKVELPATDPVAELAAAQQRARILERDNKRMKAALTDLLVAARKLRHTAENDNERRKDLDLIKTAILRAEVLTR